MARGIGIGSLVLSIFGCIWIVVGLTLLDTESALRWSLTAVTCSVILIGISLWQIVAGRKAAYFLPDPARSKRVFRNANVAQWCAIAVTVLLLNLINQTEQLPWVISMIVALHFLPLARAFQLRSYYVAAAAMIAIDLALLYLPAHQRNAFVCLATGMILLLTALYLLLWLVLHTEREITG